ncbi:cation diffusion facilitator family transporter [Microcoleus sp. bin38.metabat.b11b12b14.051]|uniref:cation diffusion facilitator family transporter n=1 Tax=Microcoleus sp. bin38.metabat.b11b12b14.051 TaxID=2742709 RepID=UPI0025CF756B|nr:cation diffusion facilitator family transporter [Microcoleus sp. bin38.metabat.b11b12b14.051]
MIFPVKDNFDSQTKNALAKPAPTGGSSTKTIARCGNSQPKVGKVRLLQTALVLLSSFFVAELIAAMASHSLSLLADAGHVLSDVAALTITLAATWFSSRKTGKAGNAPHASGLPDRPEIVAALVNSISLVAIALWIACESIDRLLSPTPEVDGLPMLITAIVGLSVNSVNAFCLHSCCHGDLNLKSAFLHAVADICSSIGVIVAAIAVAWLHWNWADGLISLLVSGAIVLLTLPLLIESIRLLLGNVSEISAIQQPCDCPKQSAENLLFPSLEELIK